MITEVDRAKTALEKGALPTWVTRHEVKAYEDASGTPALVISLYVEPAHLDQGMDLTRVRAAVRELLLAAGITMWGYVRFEDASEAA